MHHIAKPDNQYLKRLCRSDTEIYKRKYGEVDEADFGKEQHGDYRDQ